MSVQDNIERLKRKLQDFNDSDSKESENNEIKEQSCFDFSKNFETKISAINKSKNDHEIPSQHIITPNKNYEEMELDSLKKYIEELLEAQRKKDEIIESQSYRLEKLQQELASKIKQINKLNSDFNMLEQKLSKTKKQSEYFEELVNDNKNNVYPAYQKLKSQYQICYLELGALENDNKIIEEKLTQEREQKAQLNQENRKLQKEIQQMQISKLEIKRDVEKIKMKMNEDAHNLAITQSKFRDLNTDYDRLKNLTLVQQKKLEKYESNTNFLQNKFQYNIKKNKSPLQKSKTNVSLKEKLDFSAFNDFKDLNSYSQLIKIVIYYYLDNFVHCQKASQSIYFFKYSLFISFSQKSCESDKQSYNSSLQVSILLFSISMLFKLLNVYFKDFVYSLNLLYFYSFSQNNFYKSHVDSIYLQSWILHFSLKLINTRGYSKQQNQCNLLIYSFPLINLEKLPK